MSLDTVRDYLVKIREAVEVIVDIHGGTAVGLLTLAVAWSIYHGKDIGAGSAAAYATAIGAFAYTNVNGGPKQS